MFESVSSLNQENIDLLQCLVYTSIEQSNYSVAARLINIHHITQSYYSDLASQRNRLFHEVKQNPDELSEEDITALTKEHAQASAANRVLKHAFLSAIGIAGPFSHRTVLAYLEAASNRHEEVYDKLQRKVYKCISLRKSVDTLARSISQSSSPQDEIGSLMKICKYTTHIATSRTKRVTYGHSGANDQSLITSTGAPSEAPQSD